MTIHFPCAACGEKVEVESMLLAGEKICPHCGRFVIGGRRPPALGSPDAGAAYDSNRETLVRPHSRGSNGSGLALTGLAILNFLFGAMHLCCGGTLVWAFDYLQTPDAIVAMQQKGVPPQQVVLVQQQCRQITPYITLIAGAILVAGLAVMGSGYGLLKRDRFSYLLNIGLAGLFAVLGLISFVVRCDFCTLIAYGSYAATVFTVLMKYADEFRAETPIAE